MRGKGKYDSEIFKVVLIIVAVIAMFMFKVFRSAGIV